MSCYVYFYLYRCGMVFVDPEELKWLPFTQTWMNGYADKVKDEIREYILDLFVRYVDDGLTFIRKKCQQSINQVMLYVYLWIFIESIRTCITVIIGSVNVGMYWLQPKLAALYFCCIIRMKLTFLLL